MGSPESISPSERSSLLENACNPLGSTHLADGRWAFYAQIKPLSWNPGFVSRGCGGGGGEECDNPSGLKKWSLASGFMKTQAKGSILSYLGSIVSLYFVHLVSCSKCTTGGGGWLDIETWNHWSFPGGPVPKPLRSRCRGSGFNLWSGN